jgi:hypothetical protein
MMLVLPFLALLAACAPRSGNATATPEAPTLDLGQIVQATLDALTAQPTAIPSSSTPPATSASGGGSIAGRLNYPADRMPPMFVVAYLAGSSHYQSVTTALGQSSYTIPNLAPGTYHVIAYTIGGDGFPAGMAGGYTEAVPCGLATECANHSLIDVDVSAGQTVSDVNVLDWYAPPGSFPPFPGQASLPTATSSIPTGGIAGDLGYPSSFIPAQRVVAFQVGTPSYFYVDTAEGQSHYQLDHVPPGTYHVVAYVHPGGLPGGYSEMVPCGLQASCTDHTLIDVVVTAGQVTTGVDPKDFYAAPGAFPPDPTQ